jgi:hypothetical protein
VRIARIDREAAPEEGVIHARLHDKAYAQKDQAEQQVDCRQPLADRAEPAPVSHLVSCHSARTDVVHDHVPIHHALSPDCKQPSKQLSLGLLRRPGNKTGASCIFYLTKFKFS